MSYESAVSKSTDKLIALTEALKHIPETAFSKLQSFKLTWSHVDNVVVPEVSIEFYE